MAGIRDIKRQIISVQNTQKVTKAMQMVSAAKMRKSHEAMVETEAYANEISGIISDLLSVEDSSYSNPLFAGKKGVKNIALLVINSDRGLCGAFNVNVIKAASKFLSELDENIVTSIYIVGKNASDFFKRRKFNIANSWVAFGGKVNFDDGTEIASLLIDSYLKGVYDEIYVVYNQFKSITTQKAVLEKLLPADPVKFYNPPSNRTYISDYIFEPSPEEMLSVLLPRFICFDIYHKLLESAVGEHGSRMVAMDNATRSADKMVKQLRLHYNKARQAAITMDLLDIINGANALR